MEPATGAARHQKDAARRSTVLGRLGSLDPALTTVLFAVGAVASAGVLHWLTQRGGGTDQSLVDGAPFGVWIVVASLSVVLFLETLVSGLVEVRRREEALGSPTGLMSRRTRRYGCWYVAFAGLAVVALLSGGKGGPPVEIDAWSWVARGLLSLGALAAGPWVVLVWSSHDLLETEREVLRSAAVDVSEARAAARRDAAPEATALAEVLRGLDARLGELLSVRSLIAKSVTRLVGLVLAALLMSGALRIALVPDHLPEADFPAWAVVAYGAFFAVLLSLAVLPLMFAWRRTATSLLDSVYPPSVAVPADQADARGRLSAVLDIDGSLFRSPIAVSTILAPLVTSILTVLVPQLGA